MQEDRFPLEADIWSDPDSRPYPGERPEQFFHRINLTLIRDEMRVVWKERELIAYIEDDIHARVLASIDEIADLGRLAFWLIQKDVHRRIKESEDLLQKALPPHRQDMLEDIAAAKLFVHMLAERMKTMEIG